ncbi:unnamed protein product, partial [Pylaiella littoralis]
FYVRSTRTKVRHVPRQQADNRSSMADGWSGFEDGDMKLNFAGATFKVHRAVFAQASPVWNAMLTGSFAESNGDTIEFDGDDPEVARLCIE